MLSGCATPHLEAPRTYVGNHENRTIKYDTANVIMCSEPEFDNFVCMDKGDFSTMAAEILSCRGQQ